MNTTPAARINLDAPAVRETFDGPEAVTLHGGLRVLPVGATLYLDDYDETDLDVPLYLSGAAWEGDEGDEVITLDLSVAAADAAERLEYAAENMRDCLPDLTGRLEAAEVALEEARKAAAEDGVLEGQYEYAEGQHADAEAEVEELEGQIYEYERTAAALRDVVRHDDDRAPGRSGSGATQPGLPG